MDGNKHKGALPMFENETKTAVKKNENELLRELADLVARRELDTRLGIPQIVNREDIHNILHTLGYSS
jgi:hypothetical protein